MNDKIIKEELLELVVDVLKPVNVEVINEAYLHGKMMNVPTTSSSTAGTCSVEINVLDGHLVLMIRDWLSGHELLFNTHSEENTVSYTETGATGTIESSDSTNNVQDLREVMTRFSEKNI